MVFDVSQEIPSLRNEISIANLTEQLLNIGVQVGGVLVVHTSFRAVRPVQNGPRGLLAGLRAALGEQGTLVMPTMTSGTTVFDPHTTPTLDMGITSELFWRQPGVLRSTHPGGSFAAQGPHAAYICQPQPLAPPHGIDSPVGRVYQRAGQVLLLGVSHSENTTLHLAESIAKVPYSISHPCLVEENGEIKEILIAETDHCCKGFRHMDSWLRGSGKQREGRVGHAEARLCQSHDLVEVAKEQLARNPLVFLCNPSNNCEECNRARASV
jgi:aminoglycoside 3-N-acetyltransferase